MILADNKAKINGLWTVSAVHLIILFAKNNVIIIICKNA